MNANQITPDDINAKSHFWDAFGHNETEISANWIVRFCQERGKGWDSFTKQDIDSFYQRSWPGKSFGFNRLLGGPYQHQTAQSFSHGETRYAEAYIVEGNSVYTITEKFVSACHRSSPVTNDAP